MNSHTEQMNLHTEHKDAMTIASIAGEILMKFRQEAEKSQLDLQSVRSQADRLSHETIVNHISKLYPNDAILSEEGKDDTSRLQTPRVWIIDPLDGTREFGEYGRVDWAIHVALVVGGKPLVAAVAQPALQITLSTATPRSLPSYVPRTLRMMVSRTRPPRIALELAERLKADVIKMGSAGSKTMMIVRGEADLYVHSGGQYEWDSAAPVGVAIAAGAYASRIDGSPLYYNRPNPWLPDLVICRPELTNVVMRELAIILS